MTFDGGALPLAALAALIVLLALLLSVEWRQRRALRRWLEDPEAHPVPDGHGGWREIFSRLHALRKKERKQHIEFGNALERFRLAAQALPDGIVLLDAHHHIEWFNASACQHFALDPARDLGTRVEQLIRQSEFQSLLAGYRAAPGQCAVQMKTEALGAQRAERVLSVMLIPFADSGTVLLSTDVTERARTERIHRDFIANVSHELRTPLTVISGFLEQFSSDRPPDGAAARGFLGLMTEQAERMNRLVADLLTLSRLENSSQPPDDTGIDMPALIASLRGEALALSGGRHAVDIAEASAGALRGSADELRSAFGNLVFNAVRYTPAGGTITLAWRLDDGVPTFSVTDTGIGIPAEHIPRLTERFYRVDKGRSTASGGTGLGLAIVKHVLARHGGQLRIESTPGQGSVFSARFPATRRA